MTWPKAPANGSQDQRGRLVVCSLTSTSSPRSWLAPTSAQRRTPAAVEQSRVSRPGSRPNPSAGGLSTSPTLLPPRSPLLVLDLDLLLADLLGHPLLVGHGVLVQPDPLPGHDPLLDHRLLLTEDHLMLSLRDRRARGGRVAVGVGDRLTLNPDPLPLDRNGLLDLLGGDVLPQPDPAPLALGGADPQLLLRAGHGVIGPRPRGVSPDRVSAGPAPPGGAVVVEAVVAPQLPLLDLRQAPVRVDPGGVLDQLLVIGDNDVLVGLGGLGQGDEAGLGAEQAGVDQGPLGLAGLVVQVDGVDAADAAAVPIQPGCGLPRY